MSRIPLTTSKVRETGKVIESSSSGISSNFSSSNTHRRNPKSVPSANIGSTKGVQFFEFLKTIGYQPPSKLRPEHLEYAFIDDKSPTTKLVKGLMKKIKKENALDPEEVQSYTQLKSDGLSRYGKDLEEAVDFRNAIEKRLSAEQNKKSAGKERLRQLIAQRKEELSEIKSRSHVIDAMITSTQESKTKGQMIVSRLQRESKDLDIEIQVNQKRLNDKTDALKNLKKALLTDERALPSHMKNAQSLVGINWEEIIQSEDNLTSDIRPLIHKHVANLIIRAEGYEDLSHASQEADFLGRVLIKHAGNFERLKHCIIYERVRQTKLTIKLAGENGALVMLKPCLEQIRRAWLCDRDGDFFAQMQQEVDESISTLEDSFEREYTWVVENVRGKILNELVSQFETLSNVKAHAKKRLHYFFLRVYNALVNQKVRVDILRNVLKTEVNHYNNLVKKLQEYNERIFFSNMEAQFIGEDLDRNNLTTEGIAMQAFLAQHEIPLSLLRSVPGTLDALTKMHREITVSKSSSLKNENYEFKQRLNDLSLNHNQLTELYLNLKEKYLSSNCKERRRLQELENIQREMEGNLKTWEENKSRIVEESIADKRRLLNEIKDTLA